MDILKTELKDLSFSVSTFYLDFKEEIQFTPRLYFALRGSFGYFLKKIVCIIHKKECNDCLLKSNCAYAYIFNTSPDSNDFILSNYRTIPHPYVINNLEQVNKKTVKFNLVLVGKAITYFPYFILAYSKIGSDEGLYNNKFQIKKITSYKSLKDYFRKKGHIVFRDEKIQKEPRVLKMAELEFVKQNIIKKIIFLTPVRIKYSGKYVTNLEFHYLIRNLLRRISLLLYYHCGKKWTADIKEIIEKSKKIKIVKSELKFTEWERYSKRQEQKMRLGGVEGSIELEQCNELKYFTNLLIAGTILNIGKQSAFGFGNCRIEYY